MNKLCLIITGTHMGLSHDGLQKLAKKFKIDCVKLKAGELVLFLNRKNDKFKYYASNHVIGYYRSPNGQKINLEAFQYVAQAFNGQTVDMSRAERAALLGALARQRRKGESREPAALA